MCKYVIVDLEMCNVPAIKSADISNEIIQIGAVLLNEKNKACDTFMTYVKPELGMLDSFITNLTGITDEDIADAPKLSKALNNFVKWLPKETKLVSWSQSDEKQLRRETESKNIHICGLEELLNEWVDCQKTFDKIMYSPTAYNTLCINVYVGCIFYIS